MTTTETRSLDSILFAAASNYDDTKGKESAREKLLEILQNNDCRPIIATAVDGDALTKALTYAAFKNHSDILKAFADYGINVNIKDQYEGCALLSAAERGSEESARILLDHNANVDAQDKEGHTALMLATQNDKVNIVELLLAKNANADIQDNRGRTVLLHACLWSRQNIVQLLLKHNVNVDLADKRGNTAMDQARMEEIKELLINHKTSNYILK